MIEIWTPEALDDVHLIGVRVSCEIEPEPVVEANGVHDQRIALQPADRVAVPARIRVLGMLAAVQENLSIAVDVAFEQEEHMRLGLENAPWVRSLPRNTGWKALSLGIVSGHPLTCKFLRPRLERKLLALLQRVVYVEDEIPIRAPDAGKVYASCRRARCGSPLGSLSAFCLCTASDWQT